MSRRLPRRRRHTAWLWLGLLVAALLAVPSATALEPSTIAVDEQFVRLEFPEKLTFHATISSTRQITRVVLEYGVVARTCGNVTAKAFPDFTPGTTAEVEWTWEMRQSGSEPPGAQIWYRWRVTDDSGEEHLSEEETVAWLDDQHDWQTETQGMLRLHSYYDDTSLAGELLDSATGSLDELRQTTGITPQEPIDLYVYADNQDMQDAILYEPGWTGGQAFSSRNIVIIGIYPDDFDWGKRTIAHELTHVLVGHLAFTCLGDVPTWLNEGIAVYAEGEPELSTVVQIRRAVDEDTLISVRALSGGFSEHPDRADLSYAESWSLVDFLVDEYGQEKLLALFGALRDGQTLDDALRSTYSFGIDGLETAWRESIDARPRQSVAEPTPTGLPTPVPTYPPIGAVPEAVAEEDIAEEDVAEEDVADGPASTAPVPTTPISTVAPAGVAESQPTQSTSNSTPIYLVALALLGLISFGLWFRERLRR